jgi:hypothetical protein
MDLFVFIGNLRGLAERCDMWEVIYRLTRTDGRVSDVSVDDPIATRADPLPRQYNAMLGAWPLNS